MSICKLFYIVALFDLLLGLALAQTASTGVNESTEHAVFYKHAAEEIKKANPAVKLSTLNQDLALVERTEPTLRRRYPKTFSDADIRDITASAWMDFRERQPNEPIDLDKFAKFALESYGGLRITSKPIGAAIDVDSKPWSDTTNAQSSCRTGTRSIKLTKPGYEDEVGNAIVSEGRWTSFHRNLRKK
jgi:hypothetical protein